MAGLRSRIGVSNQAAFELLRQLRSDEGRPVCIAIAQPEYPAQRNALVDEGAFMRELSWKAK